MQAEMGDAVHFPKSALADQGFDAIYFENDLTGLIGHGIP